MTCPCVPPVESCEVCCPYPCCKPYLLLAEDYEDLPDMDPNPTVDDRLRRLDLSCSRCPPNRMENDKTGHKKNHGQKAFRRRDR